ncbi:sucrose-6F-phosphate phosphohydrolase (macronuclear) [Tetrahymena thermophila SB210]|uniref:Sucrose-6F-phosphate phosphohydrolase n=1 Tax=Tetrahymena thermophila (strain SB210) TaxID=312017 RepID=I7MB36_TETTS|nr:sucrose-6F-phosphate phosphohydrolase [Tetrahymena thermophila SB210]EAS07546.1 sucrose-6F-phosphate phosphohydrolase [Tetrahymena thermophila SB210]|eukprot:XP_001027788.1 sucrose-6F-phosphate phosphohydrolase [Tetrahymena thermophila SB210]
MDNNVIINELKFPLENQKEQNLNRSTNVSISMQQNQYSVILYYFDFQCLPSTYDESVQFNAENLVNHKPPFILEQIKEDNEQKQLINSQEMKRTKRAFNVYKGYLQSNCQFIQIKHVENKNINSTDTQLSIKANQDDLQAKQIVQNNQEVILDEINQQKGNLVVFSQNQVQNNQQESSTQKQQDKYEVKPCQQKEQVIINHVDQSSEQFKELIFKNPYYNINNQVDEGQNNQNNNVKRLVVYNQELIEVEQRSNRKSLIITTDLGGTLCGKPEATLEFMKYWIKYFWFDKSCKLIYNSGRGIHPFNLLMKRESLIMPDYYIGRCGSYIYLKDYTKGILYLDKQWLMELAKIWQPQIIFEKMQKLSSWLKFKVRNDPEVWSLRYNSEISVFYERENEFKQIEQELNEIGIGFNAVIREKQNLMHVEIVPQITDKGLALEYLLHKVYYPYIQMRNQKIIFKDDLTGQQRLLEEQKRNMSEQLEFIQNKAQQIKSKQFKYEDILINKQDNDIVIAAFGDTMNDDGMLKLANFSICVSNSEQQLIQWANSHQQQTHPQLYVSQHSNGYALLEFVKQYIN